MTGDETTDGLVTGGSGQWGGWLPEDLAAGKNQDETKNWAKMLPVVVRGRNLRKRRGRSPR